MGVHGDIRHLEKDDSHQAHRAWVHGDIRHLEKTMKAFKSCLKVHGDIRHLEIKGTKKESNNNSSWRHTPFRKDIEPDAGWSFRSWRHTPFRNF